MKAIKLITMAVVLMLAAPAVSARPAEDPELRDALREHLRNRLRVDLGLTDEQLAEVWPRVEAFERQRRQFQHERETAMRDLRRGYRGGAGDAELQAMLDRLREIEDRSRAEERVALDEIDETLTVRQRVGFRFVVTKFHQQVRKRIQDIRRERVRQRQRP